MSEITPQTFEKPKLHPVLANLPEYLKDHNNYQRVQLAIIEAGSTKHSHAEVVDWAKCAHCQRKQADRLMMMKELGFKSAGQYLAWKKVMDTIDQRIKYPKYNSPMV